MASQASSSEKLLRGLTTAGAFLFVMGLSAGAGYWWLNGGPESTQETARRVWDEPFELEFEEGETRKVWLDPDKNAEAMRRTLSGG
jgi:hypothetical protein